MSNKQINFIGWILFILSAIGFIIASIGSFWEEGSVDVSRKRSRRWCYWKCGQDINKESHSWSTVVEGGVVESEKFQ